MTRPDLALCVFVDALGWEIVRRRRWLSDILVEQSPLDTVLGYSSTCDPTILTGRMPREHRHFAFYYYSPATSPFRALRPLGWLPRSITDRGRLRRVISRSVARLYGFRGYFQLYNVPFHLLSLFDYAEKRDIYEPGGINGGQPTIFDWLHEHHVPVHRSNWRLGDRAAIEDLARDLSTGRPRFAYLYLAGLDAVLHAHGTTASAVDQTLAWYETELRRVLAVACTRYGKVRLHVFSDHGMTDVTGTCDLMARVEATGLRFGVDYAAVYDSTLARFWFLRPGAREVILDALATEPSGRVLNRNELRTLGCDFAGDLYGQVFFLLDPGMLLCPSFLGLRPLRGMHGYHPSEPTARATFATSVRGLQAPRALTDLYSFMQREAEAVMAGVHETAA